MHHNSIQGHLDVADHSPFLSFVVLYSVGQERLSEGRLLFPAPLFLLDVELLLLPLPDDLLYPLPSLRPLVLLRPASFPKLRWHAFLCPAI